MSKEYKISLNFSPLINSNLLFKVYRKKVHSNNAPIKLPEVFMGRLPQVDKSIEYENYYISFEKFEDSEEFSCSQDLNKEITKSYIFWLLKKTVNAKLDSGDYEIPLNSKYKRVYFILKSHTEGRESVWIEPYFLEENSKFGLLFDYKFLKNEGSKFNRRTQVLSLSLNSIGRSNTELYSDKYEKIRNFARLYYNNIFKGTEIDFYGTTDIPCTILSQKIFLVKGGIEVENQNKMREIGPFSTVTDEANVYFLHKESERIIISTFYEDLKKEIESIFKIKVNFLGHRCVDINEHEVNNLIIKIQGNSKPNSIVVVLKNNPEDENEMYYMVKHKFCSINIPVQFINYDTLKNKYAVRDFSLQIFSKIGGVPWIIKPNAGTTLIIGLAQSNRFKLLNGEKKLDRYYAYSVLLESTGLYQSISVISENATKESYLAKLRSRVEEVLKNESSKYSRVAIHAPFKITDDEIKKVKESVENINPSIEFVLMRINMENKYFGYNKSLNNLTPYEGSYAKIGKNKHLLWAEGVRITDSKSKKRYSGPIFIEFMYQSNNTLDQVSFIQELLSLSGMNWRAYNSKSVPISVQYCNLVTDFVRSFKEKGYSELKASSLKPWFL
ncbi:MAG: hypothetical protein IT260_18275 [Saprospiraceae bacterium]|nr:hypothetical protein [Saprospiraceae bacterium]